MAEGSNHHSDHHVKGLSGLQAGLSELQEPEPGDHSTSTSGPAALRKTLKWLAVYNREMLREKLLLVTAVCSQAMLQLFCQLLPPSSG